MLELASTEGTPKGHRTNNVYWILELVTEWTSYLQYVLNLFLLGTERTLYFQKCVLNVGLKVTTLHWRDIVLAICTECWNYCYHMALNGHCTCHVYWMQEIVFAWDWRDTVLAICTECWNYSYHMALKGHRTCNVYWMLKLVTEWHWLDTVLAMCTECRK